MSTLNFGTYEDQLSLINDNTYGYLLQDDLYLRDSLSNKVVKDLYIRNGQTWSQIKETYIYDQGQWKISYRKAYRFFYEINDTQTNINLTLLLQSLSTPWDGISPIKGILKITNSGILGSSNSSNGALNISSLPSNSSIVVINEGSIYGQGGNGGDARASNASDPTGAGGQGGDCIKSESQQSSTKIYYVGSGKLWAGGGGGGGGSENGPVVYAEGSGGDTRYCQGGGGGGGGQGYSTSSGGSRSDPSRNYGNAGNNGSNGNFSGPGLGGSGGSGNAGTSPERDPGGTGGTGGAWGQKGQTAPANSDSGDDGPGAAPIGGKGGEGGYILNGPIISVVTLPAPTDGYLNTSLYKGRV